MNLPKMNLPKYILNSIEKIKGTLQDYPFIASAYIFGSQISGDAGPMSDIDIALLFSDNRSTKKELIHIQDYLSYQLEKIWKIKQVDLINIKNQGILFQHNVLSNSFLIYDADPKYRIEFTATVISKYLDFEPTLSFMKKFYLQGWINRCKSL